MDTQAFKRSLHQSDRYNRRGFGSATQRAQALADAYQSKLIGKISGIFNFGAGDILEIKKYEDNSNILINFSKKNFPKISIKEKFITLNIT